MKYRVYFVGEVVQETTGTDEHSKRVAAEVVMAELSRVLNTAWQGFHRENRLEITMVVEVER